MNRAQSKLFAVHSMSSLLENYLGSLLGLAAGDALGTTLEFKLPGTFTPIIDIVGGGPFNLLAGEWTDDTSMALCLADSLIESNGFHVLDQMERYCHWKNFGYLSSNGKCFDIGMTIGNALDQFEETGVVISASSDPFTAGNGSLMRLAPVPLYYADTPRLAVAMAAKSSQTTHGAKRLSTPAGILPGWSSARCRVDPKRTLLTAFLNRRRVFGTTTS
jgi:ADP-ribosyl-[dinitrogen reductase] hydrolase